MKRPISALFRILLVVGLLIQLLPPPSLTAAPRPEEEAPPTARTWQNSRTAPERSALSSFFADLNGDQRVDGADLQQIALAWNCAQGDTCYAASLDHNSDGKIDAFDLASVGNEYDIDPPAIVITSPAEGAVVAGTSLQVQGTVTDKHPVSQVTVNGVAATLTGNGFSATIPAADGPLSIAVAASDALGQSSGANRLVQVDNAGPVIDITSPPNRQSVSSLRPTLSVSFFDIASAVQTGSLAATLTDQNGGVTNVSSRLQVSDGAASGTPAADLQQETSYTLTVSIADAAGNSGTAVSSVYVPAAPGSITPPSRNEGDGTVNGRVLDAATCAGDREFDPQGCTGIPGARVTLEKIDPTALARARAERDDALQAASGSHGLPGSRTAAATSAFTAIAGTAITGPDGFYVFPAAETGLYALRVEKDGFTYGQRVVEIVRQRSNSASDIFLTALDPAVTPCGNSGCQHASADGQMELDIPAGALPPGQNVNITATEFDQVQYLPSGELPPGTAETFAFNLGGASEISFTVPITVRIKNSWGFGPGVKIPLGYWNQELLQWEHAGSGVVSPDGVWVVMQVTHFSNYDCNAVNRLQRDLDTLTDGGKSPVVIDRSPDANGPGSNPAQKQGASSVLMQNGALRQEFPLPPVTALGLPRAIDLQYDSVNGAPSALIDLEINFSKLNKALTDLASFIQVELFIGGAKVDTFVFAVGEVASDGEVGRLRFVWDGRDAEGRLMPPGSYRYTARLGIATTFELTQPVGGIFGGEPDPTFPTGLSRQGTLVTEHAGVVVLGSGDDDAFLGRGWQITGQQRLFTSEDGQVLIDDGHFVKSRFNASQLNQLEIQDVVRTSRAFSPDAWEAASGQPLSSGARLIAPASPEILLPEESSPETSVDESAARPEGAEHQIFAPTIQASGGARNQSVAAPSAEFRQAQPAQTAQTSLNADIAVDTVLDVAGSPYVLEKDIAILPGVTLTVQPGVEIQGKLNTELTIRGALQAIGEPGKPITFTRASGQSGWSGLHFDGGIGRLAHLHIVRANSANSSGVTANVTLRNGADVEMADSEVRPFFANGFHITGSRAVLDRLSMTGSFGGIIAEDSANDLTLRDATFTLQNDALSIHPVHLPKLSNLTFIDGGSCGDGCEIFLRVNTGQETLTPGVDFVLRAFPGLTQYTVLGTAQQLIVPASSSLAVEPGLTVSSSKEVVVQGRFDAQGTEVAPIQLGSTRLVYTGGKGKLRHVSQLLGGNSAVLGRALAVGIVNGDVEIGTGTQIGQQVFITGTSVVTISAAAFAGGTTNSLEAPDGRSQLLLTGSTFAQAATTLRLHPNLLAGLSNLRFLNGNSNDIRLLAGDLTRNVTLAPFPGLRKYVFTEDMTILPGVTLRLGPGADFGQHFNQTFFGTLFVQGTLEAVGTKANPALIDTVQNIQVLPGGQVTFDFVRCLGRVACLTVDGGEALVQRSEVRANRGVKVTANGGSAAVTLSAIAALGNSAAGVENLSSRVVDARFNSWGHPTGPQHPQNPGGQGARVIGPVTILPFFADFNPFVDDVTAIPVVSQSPNDNTRLTLDTTTNEFTRHYPNGTIVRFNADGSHQFTQDAQGHRWEYSYNADGSTAQIRYVAAGRGSADWTWNFSYQLAVNSNQLASVRGVDRSLFTDVLITDPAGRSTTLTLDERGNLVQLQEPGLDAATSFTYDAAGRMTSKRTARGFVTRYVYDAAGLIARTEQPPRQVFDPQSNSFRVEQEIYPFRIEQSGGLINQRTDAGTPSAPGAPLPKTDDLSAGIGPIQMKMNGFGAETAVVDPLGGTVISERDERDLLTRLVTQSGVCIEYTYDDFHNLLTETKIPAEQCTPGSRSAGAAEIQQTTFTYETRFQKVKTETNPRGFTTTYVYDYETGAGNAGNLVEIIHPPVEDGRTGQQVTPKETFVYDAHGRIVEMVNRRGVKRCFVYTTGAAGEAANGATPLFAAEVAPVPGHLTQDIEDCGGPSQRATRMREFDALGNPLIVEGPVGTPEQRTFRYTYDSRGRQSSKTDPAGVVTRFAYDNHDNVVAIVEEKEGVVHQTSTFTYDDVDILVEERHTGGAEIISLRYGYDIHRGRTLVQDARGNRTRFFYDANRRKVKEIDRKGTETTFTYTPDGRPLTITNGRGIVSRFVYDGLARPIQTITDEGGLNLTTATVYDKMDNPIEQTDANGRRTCFELDALNRAVARTDDCGGLNAIHRHGFDPGDLPVAQTDPLGRRTVYSYNALGELTQITDALGGQVTHTLDAADQVVSISDQAGRVSTFTYDLRGLLLSETDPGGNRNRSEYDAFGQETARIDKVGRRVEMIYDGMERVAAVKSPDGSITRQGWDENDNLLSRTDARGATARFTYDPMDMLLSATDELGNLSTFAYDPVGNQVKAVDPLGGQTTTAYDGANRAISRTDANGNTTTFEYDGVGNLTKMTDALGNVTRYEYDGLYRMTRVTYANGETVQNSYDLAGNVLTRTDGRGNMTSYTYDALDRQIASTNALGQSDSMQYAADGSVTRVTNRRGQAAIYEYDNRGLLAKETWEGSAEVRTYTWDADGQLVGIANPDAVYSFAYNSIGQYERVSFAPAGAPPVEHGYTYDAAGQVTAIAERVNNQPQATTAYTYDPTRRMTRIQQSGPGVAAKEIRMKLDAKQRLTRLERLAAGNAVATSAYTHDAGDRLTRMLHTFPAARSGEAARSSAAATTSDLRWSHDKANRITSASLPGGTSSFSYDGYHQITAVDHSTQADESYAYDAAGNRSNSGQQMQADNRLSEDAAFRYEYDADGNRTKRTSKSSGAVEEYGWDHAGQLTRIVTKAAGGGVLQTVKYRYDPLGRRIRKEVIPTSGPAQVENYAWLGDQLSLVFSGSSLTNRYLYGPYLDFILADEQGGETLWPLTDHQYTVQQIVNSSGALVNQITYDSYGRVTGESNPGANHRFGFNGRDRERESGLVYYRSRYYEPGTGRFLSQDRLGFGGGDANLYRYVGNSPSNFIDPLGQLADSPQLSAGGDPLPDPPKPRSQMTKAERDQAFEDGIKNVSYWEGFKQFAGIFFGENPVVQGIGNGTAGVAHTVSFGYSTEVLHDMGIEPDQSSGSFKLGMVGGIVVGPGAPLKALMNGGRSLMGLKIFQGLAGMAWGLYGVAQFGVGLFFGLDVLLDPCMPWWAKGLVGIGTALLFKGAYDDISRAINSANPGDDLLKAVRERQQQLRQQKEDAAFWKEFDNNPPISPDKQHLQDLGKALDDELGRAADDFAQNIKPQMLDKIQQRLDAGQISPELAARLTDDVKTMTYNQFLDDAHKHAKNPNGGVGYTPMSGNDFATAYKNHQATGGVNLGTVDTAGEVTFDREFWRSFYDAFPEPSGSGGRGMDTLFGP